MLIDFDNFPFDDDGDNVYFFMNFLAANESYLNKLINLYQYEFICSLVTIPRKLKINRWNVYGIF